LDFRIGFNRENEPRGKLGFSNWRLPEIIELESLTDMTRHFPALAGDHLFLNVQDFYWPSTTSMYNTDYA
jgi:hypothetical protein